MRAATLMTTFTIPPIRGISSATTIASTPKPMVDQRAIRISPFSEVEGERRLKMSLVKTPAEMLSVALSELAVAKIMPPSIRLSRPEGIASLHISR